LFWPCSFSAKTAKLQPGENPSCPATLHFGDSFAVYGGSDGTVLLIKEEEVVGKGCFIKYGIDCSNCVNVPLAVLERL